MGVFSSPQQPNVSSQRNLNAKFSLLYDAGTPVENLYSAALKPSSFSSFSNISSLSKFNSISLVKAGHAKIIKVPQKVDQDSDVQQSLIRSHLEFGHFRSAAMIFFLDFAQNYLYWNAFLDDFTGFGGDPYEILEVFVQLQNMGHKFGSETLAIVLKLCANIKDGWLGLEVHACLIKRGFDLEVYAKCALMNFYGRCWGIDIADQNFKELGSYNSLLWNEAVLVKFRNGNWLQGIKTFSQLQFSSAKANIFTVAKVLQACGKVGGLNEGMQLHGHVIRNAMESDISICNSLIYMYSRHGDLHLARTVFNLTENRNLSTWNSIISGYTALGFVKEALELAHEIETSNVRLDIVSWNCLMSGHVVHGSYKQVFVILQRMQAAGVNPNTSSIVTVLQAVRELCYLNFAKEIHCYVMRKGLDADVHVSTSLIDIYAKNNDLNSAQAIFDYMKEEKNIVSWNTLISGYCSKGDLEKAASLLSQMEKHGIRPDLVTYNSIVSGYAIAGRTKEALGMIRRIKSSGMSPNVVSWTALISGSFHRGHHRNALEFFVQMQKEGIGPNLATIVSLLKACAGLSLLQKGKEVHCFCIRNGYAEEPFVCTALTDMYSKCGNLKDAYEVFQRAQKKTLASYNSMMMGFAIQGQGRDVISLFHRLQKAKLQPDAITLTALLSGCKNSGLIDEGWKFFDSMRPKFGINPTIEHYSCMVDLLGRAGYLDEALDFIRTMPIQPDATVWGAFLRSCRIHSNFHLGEIAANELFKIEPRNPANYVLLMNMYAAAKRWEDVEDVKDLMERKKVKAGDIWSWIEVNQRVHVFLALGKPHPDEGEIYFELYQLITEIKNVGYVPDTRYVYQKIVEEEEKEKELLSHTEKLAITYGLIKKKNSNPIRVIKNTRICADCHTFAKCVSMVRDRQIILKDGIRFHHFREGECSCRDMW